MTTEKTPLRLALEAARARSRAKKATKVAASAPRAAHVEPEPDPDAYDERWLTASERRALLPTPSQQEQSAPASNVGRVYRESGGTIDTARDQRVWHGQ